MSWKPLICEHTDSLQLYSKYHLGTVHFYADSSVKADTDRCLVPCYHILLRMCKLVQIVKEKIDWTSYQGFLIPVYPSLTVRNLSITVLVYNL